MYLHLCIAIHITRCPLQLTLFFITIIILLLVLVVVVFYFTISLFYNELNYKSNRWESHLIYSIVLSGFLIIGPFHERPISANVCLDLSTEYTRTAQLQDLGLTIILQQMVPTTLGLHACKLLNQTFHVHLVINGAHIGVYKKSLITLSTVKQTYYKCLCNVFLNCKETWRTPLCIEILVLTNAGNY